MRSRLAALLVAIAATMAFATRFTSAQRARPAGTTSADAPAELPIAVAMVGRTPRSRWDAYALTRAAPSLTPLRFSVDPGGSSSSIFEGSDMPALSPDGRWFAYFGSGRLRVRDLRTGTERVVPTTLDRARAARIGGFALDSSSLLFFDMTMMDDADAQMDEGGGESHDGIHRIFVVATGEIKTVQLDDARDTPALLEDATSLLVSESSGVGASRTSALVRLRIEPRGVTRTPLGTSNEPMGFLQLAARRDVLAWNSREGVIVAGRDGRDQRRLPLDGGGTDNQWPAFAPSSEAIIVHHQRRTPMQSGGFSVTAIVTHFDRATGATTELHTCRAACRTAFDDDTHVLVLDGNELIRVGTDHRATRLLSRVRGVAFATASL